MICTLSAIMYPACSCELEDHELIKLAVSVLREVKFTAVGLQTSMPIAYMQAVFGLVSAYRHAAVWDGIYLHFRLCLGW